MGPCSFAWSARWQFDQRIDWHWSRSWPDQPWRKERTPKSNGSFWNGRSVWRKEKETRWSFHRTIVSFILIPPSAHGSSRLNPGGTFDHVFNEWLLYVSTWNTVQMDLTLKNTIKICFDHSFSIKRCLIIIIQWGFDRVQSSIDDESIKRANSIWTMLSNWVDFYSIELWTM